MKKLMFTAAAVAVTGGVMASPLLYDYKASVKHMYLKEIKVNVYNGADVDAVPPAKGIGNKGIEVYLKYMTSASLKGVLVMDQDGATSPIVSAAYGTGTANTAKAFDYGRNRGFLIVENSKAAKNLRYPKIIPAVLDAKFMDTGYSKATMPNSGLAEGYLYLGGDAVACVRTQLDDLNGTITDRGAAPAAPAASTPGMAAIADYRWTSIALFGGQYNGPNWFYDDTLAVGPFDAFETAWDGNLPAELQIGFVPTHPFYHDTWMNGSGFGKYRKVTGGTVGKPCCGLKVTKLPNGVILDTLSGSVKGGVFLCTENLIHEAAQCVLGTYHFFDDDLHRWEDQFNTERLTDGSGTFGADAWQNDLWQDGFFEQETTDVISGTWSIKFNSKLTATDVTDFQLTKAQCLLINPAATTNDSDVNGLKGLAAYLNYACYVTHKNTNYTFVDGTEISDVTAARWIDCITGADRLPVITPKFAEYYGLFDWK